MLTPRLAVLVALLCGGQSHAQTLKTICQLPGRGGGAATIAPDGDVYASAGALFQLAPPAQGSKKWTCQNLGVFGGSAPMVPAPDGGFYLSGAGGPAYGAVYLVSPPLAPGGAWTQSTLYAFAGAPDAAYPLGNLILNQDGSLYGLTYGGGQYGYGTLYQLVPPSVDGGAWTENVLYSFASGGPNGQGIGSLVAGSGGSLFGPGSGGSSTCGIDGCGTVFQLTPPSAPGGAWQETIVYAFKSQADGENPASLVWGPSEAELYGITNWGGSSKGSSGDGTVFALTPPSVAGRAWRKTTIFKSNAGSGVGLDGLVLGTDGNLYGTAANGGTQCGKNGRGATCGTVFELIAPAAPGGKWTEQTIHKFAGKATKDGAVPTGLAIGPDGTMYGLTEVGGTGNGGTVFEIKP